MSPNTPRRGHTRSDRDRPANVRAGVVSDGTLHGTEITLPSGATIRNVQSLDVHIGPDGGSCTVTVGHVAVDYGPATIDLTDAELHLQPGATPRER